MSAPLFADLALHHSALRETFLALHESVQAALERSADTLSLCRNRRERDEEIQEHWSGVCYATFSQRVTPDSPLPRLLARIGSAVGRIAGGAELLC